MIVVMGGEGTLFLIVNFVHIVLFRNTVEPCYWAGGTDEPN